MDREREGVYLDAVLPIFATAEGGDGGLPSIVDFVGASFLMAPNLAVTCRHCVEGLSPGGAAVLQKPERGPAQVRPGRTLREQGIAVSIVEDIAFDDRGHDLATCRLRTPLTAGQGLKLAPAEPLMGADVCTYGFPLHERERVPGGPTRIGLNARYLEGYITSYYKHDPAQNENESMEIDMPAPAGLSGSPIFSRGTTDVVGIVCGERSVSVALHEEERTEHDGATSRLEVHRFVSFARGLRLSVLATLITAHTDGRELWDYLGDQASGDG